MKHQLERIVEKLTSYTTMELGKDMESINTKELGEVADIIKDLAKAMYYISEVSDGNMYYGGRRDRMGRYTRGYEGRDMDSGRMYYSGERYGFSEGGELENYMKELGGDIAELLGKASPNEKAMAKSKLMEMANKM